MKKFKNIIKIIVIIILIIVLALLCMLIYKKLMINKFVNLLNKSDSSNYELIQSDGTTTTTVKVKDGVLVSEDDDTIIWISENENIRIIMDKNYYSAIITENFEEAEVGSLNLSYINDYFENSDWKFKYLGKEDDLYKVQFTNKDTGAIVIFYINNDTGVVEKLDEDFGGDEVNLTFEVSFDVVTDEDVAYPDLTAYTVRNFLKYGVNY